MSFTGTIVLSDFAIAVQQIPEIRNPELHLAIYCVQMCGRWADYIKADKLHLTFDRNEPFRGHVSDRWNSPRAKKEEHTWAHIVDVAEADSPRVPALQAADLIAWCVGKRHDGAPIVKSWQRSVLSAHKEDMLFDLNVLKNPMLESLSQKLYCE
jgi:hypothetical protein